MNPNEFVQQLAEAAPQRDSLATVGVIGAAAARLQQSFLCTPRPAVVERPHDVDEAIALVESWDASHVEIGMVHFSDRSIRISAGTQIGTAEADPLVVKLVPTEVVVVEAGEPSHVLWYAAMNGGRLLDALLIAAQFLAKRITAEIDLDDTNAAHAGAIRCAAAAGGTKYYPFYSMLLGADR